VASSTVFHPDIDLGEHDAARAEIEARLVNDGWERVPDQPLALVGLRFQRRKRAAHNDRVVLPSAVVQASVGSALRVSRWRPTVPRDRRSSSQL
jgi:hypothetical protein